MHRQLLPVEDPDRREGMYRTIHSVIHAIFRILCFRYQGCHPFARDQNIYQDQDRGDQQRHCQESILKQQKYQNQDPAECHTEDIKKSVSEIRICLRQLILHNGHYLTGITASVFTVCLFQQL